MNLVFWELGVFSFFFVERVWGLILLLGFDFLNKVGQNLR